MRRSLLMSLALLIALARPALASCAVAPPLRERLGEARVAFVGTVLQTTNRDRNASVRVESIWLGPRLPERVEVTGGPSQANVVSSADRSWEAGQRYLFVLDDAKPPFKDDVCSATTPYTSAIARLEPEGVISPENDGGSGPWLLVAVALVGLGALQARRAMRRARSVDI